MSAMKARHLQIIADMEQGYQEIEADTEVSGVKRAPGTHLGDT